MRGSIGDDRFLALVAAVRQLLKAKGGNVRWTDGCDMSARKIRYCTYGLVTIFDSVGQRRRFRVRPAASANR